MQLASDFISRGFSRGLFAQGGQNFWLPEQASTVAPMVDSAFYFLLTLSAFFFCLIVVLMVTFVVLFRRRPGQVQQKSASHNTFLEMFWTSIPILLVLIIFYQNFKTYLNIRFAPAPAYEIEVFGKQWAWLFRYPDGHSDNTLYAPAGRPVLLVMTSQDVIHGLSIPAFRINMDVVPGRYTKIWFNAQMPGEYQLFCTQYCGADPIGGTTGHSDMVAKVKVLEPKDFDAYLADAKNFLKKMPPAQAGALLYERYGCVTCHSVDGTKRTGPTFKGIWGHTVEFRAGPSQEVDENYLRESILEPSAKIVKDYPDQMPTFKGVIKDEEISAIIAYIKSLKK
jgi:cytochrome c oxidase subunit II